MTLVVLILLGLGLCLPLWLPQRNRRRMMVGVQFMLLPVWGLIGWTIIAPWWWERSGGCTAHGGSFEGACGYAGIAIEFGVTIVFVAGLSLLSGMLILAMGRIGGGSEK